MPSILAIYASQRLISEDEGHRFACLIASWHAEPFACTARLGGRV